MTFEKALQGKKAALIDMDGVLYDSMPLHCRSWHETMLLYGLDIPAEEFFQHEGRTGTDTINLIMGREKGITLSRKECDKIYALKTNRFRLMAPPLPMSGANVMISRIQDAGLTTVLVTGSAQSSLLSRLDSDYPGVFPLERRVTALDVNHGKPHPEPYLRGLEKAGVEACEAIVIENAPLGVRAGKAAGIFTVAWMTGPIPECQFLSEGADLLLPRNYFS